jgi:putative transposase
VPQVRARPLGEPGSLTRENMGIKFLMPRGLQRFHESGQSHFLTFSCYRRQAKFRSPEVYDLFSPCLDQMRRRFAMCIYGYVVMPEHVHLLVSEPRRAAVPQVRVRYLDANLGTLADAIHYLKLSFAKQLRSRTGAVDSGSFWQKRYYDRNVRGEREFMEKLLYLHRNPVKRGLVKEPAEWKWSSFRHYALREIGVVEIESQWTARDRETKVLGGPERMFLTPGSRSFLPGESSGLVRIWILCLDSQRRRSFRSRLRSDARRLQGRRQSGCEEWRRRNCHRDIEG